MWESPADYHRLVLQEQRQELTKIIREAQEVGAAKINKIKLDSYNTWINTSNVKLKNPMIPELMVVKAMEKDKIIEDIICNGIKRYINKYNEYNTERQKYYDAMCKMDNNLIQIGNKVENIRTEISQITEISIDDIIVDACDCKISIRINDKIKLLDLFRELSMHLEDMDVRCYINKCCILIVA